MLKRNQLPATAPRTCRPSCPDSLNRQSAVIQGCRTTCSVTLGVTTSDKRRFPDLPDVSRDRGDVPRALVLLSVVGRQRESSASTRSRSFRTGSGIRRIGGAAYQSRA